MPLDLFVSEYDSRTQGMHKALRDDDRIAVALTFCWDDRTMVFDFGMIDSEGRHKRSFTDFVVAAGTPVDKPPLDPPKFQLGFKQVAETNPSLVGGPLENEYGFVEGLSLQRTENGILFWADTRASGSHMGFVDLRDGNRYRWNPSAGLVKVAAS